MIHPLRDFRIALAILLVGLAACAFAAFGPGGFEDSPPRMVAAAAGFFFALFGAFMTWNFSFAMRLARKLMKGEGVIGSWTIPSATMQAFLAGDAANSGQANLWRPKPDAGPRDIDIRFGPELILVDGQLLSIPTVGTQCFRAVQVIPSQPPVIAFAIQIMVTRGATVQSLSTLHEDLRLPAPDLPQAEAVRSYFQSLLDGKVIVAPNRWTVRIKIGWWIAALSFAVLLAGYGLAEMTGWRDDTAYGLAPMIMMIVGLIFTPAGLVIVLFASRFHRTRQKAR